MTIQGIVESGNIADELIRSTFYSKTGYVIDGMEFTLRDIRHGVFRSNNGACGFKFEVNDRRAKYVLIERDPRVHLAACMATKYSVPYRSFHPETLDVELEEASLVSAQVAGVMTNSTCNPNRNYRH